MPVDVLVELAPDISQKKKRFLAYDPRLGMLAWREQIQFGKRTIAGTTQVVNEDTTENRKTFVVEFSKWAQEQIERQRQSFARFHKRVPKIPSRQVEAAVKQFSGIISLDQLHPDDKKSLLSLAKLETYVGEKEMQRLYSSFRRPYSHRKTHKRSSKSRRDWPKKRSHRWSDE